MDFDEKERQKRTEIRLIVGSEIVRMGGEWNQAVFIFLPNPFQFIFP
jgi:hypothetical protein